MQPDEYEKIAGGVRLLTISEACAKLGVARSTFYELVASNRITLRKLGAASRVRSDELDDLIAGLPAVQVAPRERR